MLLGVWSLVALFSLAYFVFWIWVVADVLRRPADQWRTTGYSQVVWLLAIIVFHVIGPILYLLMARPALQRAEFASGDEGGGIIR